MRPTPLCHIGSLALALTVSVPAWAGSITENYTLTVPAGTPVGSGVNIASTTFLQFNPAFGTLDGISSSFTGSGTSTSYMIELSLVAHGGQIVIGNLEYSFAPGTVNFNLSNTDSYLPELTSFIGVGLAQVDLRIQGSGGTFTTQPVNGSITYDYTAAVASIPEPDCIWLSCTTLVAIGFFRARKISGPA